MAGAGLGRAAENLRVYAGVEAFHAGEMALLDRPTDAAAIVFVGTGRRAFYLLPLGDRETPARLASLGSLRPLAERRGRASLEWFVDPRRAPNGVGLYELEVGDEMRARLRAYLRLGEVAASGQGRLPPATPGTEP
jgi:hypothetical protein